MTTKEQLAQNARSMLLMIDNIVNAIKANIPPTPGLSVELEKHLGSSRRITAQTIELLEKESQPWQPIKSAPIGVRVFVGWWGINDQNEDVIFLIDQTAFLSNDHLNCYAETFQNHFWSAIQTPFPQIRYTVDEVKWALERAEENLSDYDDATDAKNEIKDAIRMLNNLK